MPANRSGAGLSNPAVTMFVFLPRSARARIVATDLLPNADKRRWRYSGGAGNLGAGEALFRIGAPERHPWRGPGFLHPPRGLLLAALHRPPAPLQGPPFA